MFFHNITFQVCKIYKRANWPMSMKISALHFRGNWEVTLLTPDGLMVSPAVDFSILDKFLIRNVTGSIDKVEFYNVKFTDAQFRKLCQVDRLRFTSEILLLLNVDFLHLPIASFKSLFDEVFYGQVITLDNVQFPGF